MFNKPKHTVYNIQRVYTNGLATASIVTGALFGVFLVASFGYFMLVALMSGK